MVGPLDEYPIHQIPAPVTWAGPSDRNFYDRCYINAHDRTGDIFLITGAGYYPNLGVKDAFVLVRRGDTQTAVHLSDLIDDDRLNQHVGAYRIEVTEPLRRLRVVLEETEGVALDIAWEGSFEALQEHRHVMRAGSRVTLDAQRFAQLGTWEGTVAIDGEEIQLTRDRWVGSRDRSWGIRPVGEAPPAGAPADPEFEGMWWWYTPLRFDDFAIVMIIQEEPDGYRILNDCNRVWADGRIEQLGWPRITVHYASGTRTPTHADVHATAFDGTEIHLRVEPKLAAPIHVGGGYGGDPDWLHGTWKGGDFTERIDYDMTSEEVTGRVMFGMTDYVGRAVLREGDRLEVEGWGLFEHGVIGRHDPSGFADFFTLAP